MYTQWRMVFNERIIQAQIDISVSLVIAKYILLELVDGKSFNNLAAEFSNDAVFIYGIAKYQAGPNENMHV
jgi:hypothetical protein